MLFKYSHTPFVLGLLLAASPVQADWEATRWDMSPKEAVAVLKGATEYKPTAREIYEDAGKKYAPLVKLEHEIEGIDGEVSLLFDTDDKLHFVMFIPKEISQCDELGAALTERYGATDAVSTSFMSITDWIDGGDAIKLTSSPNAKICNLSYSRA